MPRHLGDFGTPRPALDDVTFGWLGRDFRVHPDLTDLNLFEFMEHAQAIDETDEPAAMELVTKQLSGLVHPDDYAEFLAHSIAHRQRYQDLMALMKGLIEGTSDRPTPRRSDSASGRRKTKGKSKRNSSAPVEGGGPATAVVRRLEREGRPDLALTVVEAVEQRYAG